MFAHSYQAVVLWKCIRLSAAKKDIHVLNFVPPLAAESQILCYSARDNLKLYRTTLSEFGVLFRLGTIFRAVEAMQCGYNSICYGLDS